MDWEAYRRVVRRACFVCELLAGNPHYPHHVVYRDGATVAFLSRLPWWPGPLAPERGYLDIPDQAQAT
jgi:hypothetical protein